MYRRNNNNNQLEVFLVHPGGPFWKNKDSGAWSIPKGEVEKGEQLLEAAKREFSEETGIRIKQGTRFLSLGKVKQKAKVVHAWSFEGDWLGIIQKQNMITVKIHGKKFKVPEVDKAGFFSVKTAKEKIVKAQGEFIDRLIEKIKEE